MLPVLLLFTSSIAAIHNVRSYGAKGDNATDDTAAFVAAIAAVATDTHGTVLVPTGGVYLIAPINMTSNIDFHIESGARIVGVMDFTKWPIIPGAPSYGQGRNHGAHSPRFTSLIHGEHLTNVTIRGDGDGSVLDGQGRPRPVLVDGASKQSVPRCLERNAWTSFGNHVHKRPRRPRSQDG